MSLAAVRSTAYLTKDELAQALGISEALVRQWTRDGTIPEHFYHRSADGDRAYRYAPITVALGELMLELGAFFGTNSPIPKAVARQVVPSLERAWQESGSSVRLTVTHGALEVRAPLTFVARAKEKLAAFA